MTIWADILDDVAHNRSLADILRVDHDPEWDAWESAAEAALRHGKHNQKDHTGGGMGSFPGGDAGLGRARSDPRRGARGCHNLDALAA